MKSKRELMAPQERSLSPQELSNIVEGLFSAGRPVYSRRELQRLLRENRWDWRLSHPFKPQSIVDALKNQDLLREEVLKSDHYRDVTRFVVTALQPDIFHMAVSLRSGAYLSHASAVFYHDLTQQLPRMIYVNKELSPKHSGGAKLSQEAIERAFEKPQRQSKNFYRWRNYQIVLLSGKHTNRLGVIRENNADLWVTNLERTLIDITVRPRYAGGVFQVARAFETAWERLSVSNLFAMLDEIDHRYPYHQALGFYLERAGASERQLAPFRERGIRFDFYLDYSMASPAYDNSWRVFHPRGI